MVVEYNSIRKEIGTVHTILVDFGGIEMEDEYIVTTCCGTPVHLNAVTKCASDSCGEYMCDTHIEDAITFCHVETLEEISFCSEECMRNSGIEYDEDWVQTVF